MKNALALLFALMMTISLCACAQKADCTCNCACGQTAAESSASSADEDNLSTEQPLVMVPESSTPSAGETESAEESQIAADAKSSPSPADESELAAEQQLIVDAVKTQLHSETFAAWQRLAKDFQGSDPRSPEVTAVYHYSIDDFEGEAIDCYLVNISADVGYWRNEEAQEGGSVRPLSDLHKRRRQNRNGFDLHRCGKL